MKPYSWAVLTFFSFLLLSSCTRVSVPSASQPTPSISPGPPTAIDDGAVLFELPACKPTAASPSDLIFVDLIPSDGGWEIQMENGQEKEVAVQSLTFTFPTREVPQTATAKIKTVENEVECWRKMAAGRFEGCTSTVNYQIKGNEAFSLLFQNIDFASEIPSWHVKVGYKKNEPPTRVTDIQGNPVTYFQTYDFEMECG